MKIAAPASNLEEIRHYAKLKVDEIYLGFKSPAERKWSTLNKRNEPLSNFSSLQDISQVKKLNTYSEISLTLNYPFYGPKLLRAAKKQVISFKDYIDNFIISAPSIIQLVKKHAPEKGIILSCIYPCFNSRTASFFSSLGIKKIILPRHLTVKEITGLAVANPEIRFEAMVINQYCKNIDGFCSRCHIPTKKGEFTTCSFPSVNRLCCLGKTTSKETVQKNINSISQYNPFCGLCFIKQFHDAGIDSIKIVGRSNPTERKKTDIEMIKKAMSNVHLSQPDYIDFCRQLFREYFFHNCKNNCYY
ncbi:hypothetical protein GF323_02320 [Candidatus Woesearchaeota archaeon]|nr:hypothetical protein [Candidatus Woesearchaeota archaeon]